MRNAQQIVDGYRKSPTPIQLQEIDLKERKNARMYKLCQEIYDVFEPYLDSGVGRVEASHFEHLRNTHAPPTIIKAKRILGIRSVRRAGVWWWTKPLRTYDQNLARIHRAYLNNLKVTEPKADDEEQRENSTTVFVQLMRDNGYDVSNSKMIEMMKDRGYTRTTTVIRKGQLKILSQKHEDGWHWLWPCKEVQDWIMATLKERGSIPRQTVYDLAKNDPTRKYSEAVIDLAKNILGIGTVALGRVGGVWHWSISAVDREVGLKD